MRLLELLQIGFVRSHPDICRSSQHAFAPGYYGNSFVFSAVISKAKELCEKPLGYALELVMKTKAKVTEEYIRSAADFMVIKGRPPYSSSWNFIVCDMTNATFGEVDFG